MFEDDKRPVVRLAKPDEAYFWAPPPGCGTGLLMLKGSQRAGVEFKRADTARYPVHADCHARHQDSIVINKDGKPVAGVLCKQLDRYSMTDERLLRQAMR